jgi:hypothetical protein
VKRSLRDCRAGPRSVDRVSPCAHSTRRRFPSCEPLPNCDDSHHGTVH